MKFENQQYYNCKIELDNGEEFWVSANWLHNNQLDQWKDWLCSAGSLRLNIDENFNVYSGECNNDYLGNLSTDWSPLEALTICKNDRCTGCTDDLLIKKHKNV